MCSQGRFPSSKFFFPLANAKGLSYRVTNHDSIISASRNQFDLLVMVRSSVVDSDPVGSTQHAEIRLRRAKLELSPSH